MSLSRIASATPAPACSAAVALTPVSPASAAPAAAAHRLTATARAGGDLGEPAGARPDSAAAAAATTGARAVAAANVLQYFPACCLDYVISTRRGPSHLRVSRVRYASELGASESAEHPQERRRARADSEAPILSAPPPSELESRRQQRPGGACRRLHAARRLGHHRTPGAGHAPARELPGSADATRRVGSGLLRLRINHDQRGGDAARAGRANRPSGAGALPSGLCAQGSKPPWRTRVLVTGGSRETARPGRDMRGRLLGCGRRSHRSAAVTR